MNPTRGRATVTDLNVADVVNPTDRANTGVVRRARGLPIHAVAIVTAVLSVGGFLIWSIGYVPPNMDEFNHPYRLACTYPYAHLNTNPPFLIGCNSYWIDYGLFAYQRGFMYIGLTSSILYFPLWWLWRSPYSYLLMGALFLLAFSWLMVRALGLNRKYALVALSYFPIAYSFIHDTGPLRLSLLSYPLLVLMLFRLLDHRNMLHKVVYAVGCALLMVVCVEDKPFYVFLLPSVAIFAVACRAAAGPAGGLTADLWANRKPLAIFAAVLAAGLGGLLFLGTTEGRTYFFYLKDAPERTFRTLAQAASILAYTVSFPRYAHRVFEIARPWQLVAATGTVLLALWTVVAAWTTRSPNRRALMLFGLSYAAGAIVFLAVRTPWAGHHYVFLHVPALAVLLLVARADARRFTIAVAATASLMVLSIAILSGSRIDPKSARERSAIFTFLSRPDVARGNVINFSSFGGYYHQALFGDDAQLVTWSHSGRRNREPALELHRLAELTSRKIINVCRDCDAELMRAFFATERVNEIDLDLHEWKVFEIDPR